MSILAALMLLVPLQAEPSAAEILQGLDMTSFRNSTRPNREPGLRRPSDWSFNELRVDDEWTSLERSTNRWTISLRIIRATPDGVIACFNDRGGDGATYSSQQTLLIVRDDLGGYRVVDENLVDPTCQPMPGQG